MIAAVDRNRGDAEAGRIGERIAGIAERHHEIVDMAALDDAEARTAEQHHDGQGDAGAVRKITFDQMDQAIRPRTIDHPLRRDTGTTAQPLAQQHGRPNGGGFQVSLGPQRSQRPSEASCTIHCTSLSKCCSRKVFCEFGTDSVSGLPELGADLKSEQRGPAAKRHMRRQR
nr:Unknown Function [uncultured bacterium]